MDAKTIPLSPLKKFSLLVLVVLLAALALFWRTRSSLPWEHESAPATTNRLNTLEVREQAADRTIWAKEILAEHCGRTFENLWDAINAATNKLPLLANFPVGEIILPHWSPVEHLPHEIELHSGDGPGDHLSPAEWKTYVAQFINEGWHLENLEFRHNRFDVDTKGAPAQSRFYFSAHLTNSFRPERAMFEGDLVVNWGAMKSRDESPPVKQIDASHLKLKNRSGEPFFKKIFEASFKPTKTDPLIDPLIVYDLDGDGLPEILLPTKSVLYRRHGEDHYEPEPLCSHPLEGIMTAVIADFDGDGHADLLCATAQGLFLFSGSAQGTFGEPARQVWTAHPSLKDAMVLTCGDIDGDGDLDVFIGQYKVPTLGQVIRPSYYDANDGFPSYLLLNDGQGNFLNVTEGSGLGRKRWRRTYSASFVDLDGDGHLDLVVVSDFGGLDVYRNDGHGHFIDVTRQWVPEPHAFGMATALADFNVDGRLDLLMIGMPSPTVDRLQHLGLWRSYYNDDQLMRPAMTFGNRLLLAKPDGGFEQTALSESIARSGWSWGCAAFDFDNDGFPDVYLANGLESKQSVRDYEGDFWLHDIFIGSDVNDLVASHYYQEKFKRTRGSGWSYGGYEHNRLFLNRNGEIFTDIGQLAGVALEQDTRNVVATDLDRDGRLDLVLTTLEVWPEEKQTLQMFQNNLANPGRWIGFQLRESLAGKSPVGAQVTVKYGGRTAIRQIVTGDSHRSQSPAIVHFGLGSAKSVDSAQIQWPGGISVELKQPRLDTYHAITGPKHAQ